MPGGIRIMPTVRCPNPKCGIFYQNFQGKFPATCSECGTALPQLRERLPISPKVS